MIPVLFIAYHFPPGGGAGVQRSEKFVRYLPSEGFLPIVVTGAGASPDRWTPSDAGLGNGFLSDVRVLRPADPMPQLNGNWKSRLERWLGAPDGFSRWWVQTATGLAAGPAIQVELIFSTMSPFASAQVASQISAKTGIPWVADLRDPWALDEMQIYPSWFHRGTELRRMERLLSTASAIIMNTPEATAALLEVFPGLEQRLVATITNGYDPADFAGEPVPRHDSKFRIVHTGYLHTDQGLEVRRKRRIYNLLGGIEAEVDILTRSHVFLLQALERWTARHPEVAQDLEVVFAGVASGADKAAAQDSKFAGLVRFTDYISHSESVALIRTADLLFLPMHNLATGRRARIVPGKTYEYMAAARPILAAVPEGDARDFLGQSGLAHLCRPDDVEGMITQLDHVYTAWKAGATAAAPNWEFIRRFERPELTRRLAQVFHQVLKSSRSSLERRAPESLRT